MSTNVKLKPRIVLKDILRWIEAEQLVALIGSRQVGKTSIMRLIGDHLIENGVEAHDIFYFDLEDLDHLDLLNAGPGSLLAHVKAGTGRKKYVFIDEVQYMDNPSNVLKQLVDHHSRDIKLFVSGSSALNIRRKFQDSLAGRKATFEIYPLSFNEFVRFKGEDGLAKSLESFNTLRPPEISSLESKRLSALYEDYLIFGGYPGIALLDDPDLKRRLLNDIYVSYVRKDVQALFSLDNISAFNRLVKLLALRVGNLINIHDAAKEIGVSRPTVEKYLAVLNDTFVCHFVTPFFSNKNKELVKMSKVYFHDTGLRNRVLNDFKSQESRSDLGALVENSVFANLLYLVENKETIKFWRTKGGAEVDFVLDGEELTAIEVKAGSVDKTPPGLRSFTSAYAPARAIVINRDITKRAESILFLPHFAVAGKN